MSKKPFLNYINGPKKKRKSKIDKIRDRVGVKIKDSAENRLKGIKLKKKF